MPFPANYNPWATDVAFKAVFEQIYHFTLVDITRCYELWQLTQEVSDMKGSYMEVGVWRGGTSALIKAAAEGCRDPSPFYACECFKGVVKAGQNDTFYKGGEHADCTQHGVETLFKALKLKNIHILAGIFPEDTANQISKDEQFKLCHIDVDTYQSARDVVQWVWPRLVSGGILIFDDYGFKCCPGIAKLVNSFRQEPDRIVLHNLNGHGIVIKK